MARLWLGFPYVPLAQTPVCTTNSQPFSRFLQKSASTVDHSSRGGAIGRTRPAHTELR